MTQSQSGYRLPSTHTRRRHCMNKSELIDAIAAGADISKAAAGRALDAAVGAITTAVSKGDSVTLVGFSSFKSAKRAAPARTEDRRCHQDPGDDRASSRLVLRSRLPWPRRRSNFAFRESFESRLRAAFAFPATRAARLSTWAGEVGSTEKLRPAGGGSRRAGRGGDASGGGGGENQPETTVPNLPIRRSSVCSVVVCRL